MFVPNRELGDFLLDARLIGPTELADFSSQANDRGVSLHTILLSAAAVPEDELTRAAAHVAGVPFITLEREDISPDALLLIPEPLARSHSIAAFRIHGASVAILVLDLDDLAAADFLRDEGYRISPHLTDRATIKRALMLHQKILKEKFGDRMKKTSDPSNATDALISHALMARASDIHLEQRRTALGESELLVRYRIGRRLHEAMVLPGQAEGIFSRIKELSKLSFTLQSAQEGRFKIALGSGEQVSVAVSTLPVQGGERMTLHLGPERSGRKGFTFESLGFHGAALSEIYRTLGHSSGLILVSTPKHARASEFGSGRTTLLYSAIDFLSSPHVSIVTVEKNLDLTLPHVAQTLIRPDIGLTSGAALRAVLKQDPDIVVIDELKDDETAALAAHAASRGLLVIAGIEATSCAAAIEKLHKLGVSPALVASTLVAVVSQRVARRLCEHCKKMDTVLRARIAPLEAHANFGRVLAALKEEGVVAADTQWKEIPFGTAAGCEKCENGYSGLIGFQEILPISATVQGLIKSDASQEEIEEEAQKDSPLGTPLTIGEDGLFKAAQGKTTLEEVAAILQ